MSETVASEQAGAAPEAGGSLFNYFEYNKVRLNSMTDLRRLRDLSAKLKLDPEVIRLTEDVLERIEDGSFSIAVVGEFKRGKSTFINALLGKEILPADVLPCSATLNRIVYGLKPGVTVRFKPEGDQPGVEERIGVDQLTDYVTKLTPEAEQRAAKIEEAVVTYPLEYLKHGVEIVDTPGLNDDQTMTAVTMSVVPTVDAAILVIMPEAPFAASEGEFLTDHLLLQDLGRVIFVVTAIDRIRRASDRERLLDAIKKRIASTVESRLAEQFGKDTDDYKLHRRQFGEPKIFGLSGGLALDARLENDPELLEESRFPEFEGILERFLTETRGAVELKVIANRTVAAADSILKKIGMELSALEMDSSEFEERYATALAEMEPLRERRQREAEKMQESAARTRRKVRALLAGLEEDLHAAARKVLDEAEIEPADIKKDNLPQLTEKLFERVGKAVRNASQRGGEKIQHELQKDLVAEADRLSDFAGEVGRVLDGIEVRFTGGSSAGDGGTKADALDLMVGGITGSLWGGVMSGYREAGGKGALVGGAAGLSTFFAGGFVLGLLSLPLSWPAFIAMGLLSTFAGKFAARKAFGGERVEKFRSELKEHVLEQISQQFKESQPEQTVDEQVRRSYRALEEQLVGEIDAQIQQTRSTLDELRAKKARDETLSEQRREEVDRLRGEVAGIRNNGLRLASELSDIADVLDGV